MLRNPCKYLLALQAGILLLACASAPTQARSTSRTVSISSFSPASGPVGATVAIYGDGFSHIRSVTFNGTRAQTYAVVSATQINALVPAGASTGPVSVQTNWSTGTSTSSFSVTTSTAGPKISSFSPASGPSGTAVTVAGSGFTGASAVKFNGMAASFSVGSDSSIATHVPTGASTGNISVTTAYGTATSSTPFTVSSAASAPVVSSFSPTSGGVGTAVTISGSGFTGATSVAFGSVVAGSLTVVSDAQIKTTVPSGASSGLISITTTAGTGSSTSAFTVLGAPLVTSFSPTSGAAGTAVTITGTGFTGATAVKFNGISASPIAVNSDTQISTTVPSGATTGPISVTTAGGTGASSTSFTVPGNIRFFSDSSFWNTPIPSNPSIDPNSASIMSTSITPYTSNANFTDSTTWGISLATATPTSKVYTIVCLLYGCGNTVTFPIPSGALPDTGSDHHLVVINPANYQELDLWQASYDSRTDTWSASSRYVLDYGPNGWGACGLPGAHCNSGVAAGFAEIGGVVRPEEIKQGHIDHALSITMTVTKASYIACPATHTDGNTNSAYAIPEGAHIQLDPAFNVDAQSWPTWEKIMAKALQTYGAYVSDTGGTIAIYGQSDMNAGNLSWTSVGVPENGGSLSNLPWSQFRVLTIQSCN